MEANDSHEIKAFSNFTYFYKRYINAFLALAMIATIMYIVYESNQSVVL